MDKNSVVHYYNKFRKAPVLLLLLAFISMAAAIYFVYLDFQFHEIERWCLTACKQENRTVKECVHEICSISNSGAAVGFVFVAVLAGASYAIIWVYLAENCLAVVKSFRE